VAETAPGVSVVVATRDRRERLAELLESLRGQTSDRFEVVVVDDGSTDGTPELLERERERGELDLRAIRRERGSGPARARNEGVGHARAPLVAFIDDDCVASPGWVEALLAAAETSPGAVLQGRTRPQGGRGWQIGPFARSVMVEHGGPPYETCNIAYPRELFERLHGFDADAFPMVAEDMDLAYRAIEDGAEVRFQPEALAHHAVLQVGPLGKLRHAARWADAMQIYRRHPSARANLVAGVFWKGNHYLLFRALFALLLPRRLWPLRRWLAGAYFAHLWQRGFEEGGGPLLIPYFLAYDVVEAATVVRGAVRHRTVVL
jgi:GT2 family glycosyltransferase